MSTRPFFRIFISLSLFFLLANCAQAPAKSNKTANNNPLNQTVQLRQRDPQNPQSQEGIVVERQLVRIVANNTSISINGVKIGGVTELKKWLEKARKPVITIASHKCLATDAAAEILRLAQQSTDTPVAFSSYGNYDDAQCQ